MRPSMEERLRAARERGRHWGERELERDGDLAGWHVPGTTPRWRAPELVALVVKTL